MNSQPKRRDTDTPVLGQPGVLLMGVLIGGIGAIVLVAVAKCLGWL